MGVLKGMDSSHRLVKLAMPDRPPFSILCLVQNSGKGKKDYYILAESASTPLQWKCMVHGNAVHRLRDEFLVNITDETEVDPLDVETILFLSTTTSKL